MALERTDKPSETADVNIILRALGLQGQDDGTSFDTREAHQFPFENDCVLVAVSTGITPRYGDEDGVYWPTALGYATLDTQAINLLSPSIDGRNWVEKIETYTLTVEGRQSHAKTSSIARGLDQGVVVDVPGEKLQRGMTDGPAAHPRSIMIIGDHISSAQCNI